MRFMLESLEGSEISQEYAISLVPQKFASRIKRFKCLNKLFNLVISMKNHQLLIKEEEYIHHL